MVYTFDFEFVKSTDYVFEVYSAVCNLDVDKSRLEGEGLVYIIFEDGLVQNYEFAHIFKDDIIVMGWK